MNIEHFPLFDTAKVEKIYSEKDGVEVKYICTTDLNASDVPVDVFYRATPHPEFGNRYFGLYHDHVRGHTMITNADIVESFDFALIEVDGKYYYSQSHHDYKSFADGEFIDGGRAYTRTNCGTVVMRIIDGKFIAKDVEDLFAYQPGGCCQQ